LQTLPHRLLQRVVKAMKMETVKMEVVERAGEG
jgi:hypothetical protein